MPMFKEAFIAELLCRVILDGTARPSQIHRGITRSTKSRAVSKLVEEGYLRRLSRQNYAAGRRLQEAIAGLPVSRGEQAPQPTPGSTPVSGPISVEPAHPEAEVRQAAASEDNAGARTSIEPGQVQASGSAPLAGVEPAPIDWNGELAKIVAEVEKSITDQELARFPREGEPDKTHGWEEVSADAVPTPSSGDRAPDLGMFSLGIVSREIVVKLLPLGVLECRYTLVVDTGMTRNPYAAGAVVAELWASGVFVAELKKGCWDISGYPVIAGSRHTWTMEWRTSLSDLGSQSNHGTVRIVPVDPRQALVCSEAETDLLFLGGMKSWINIRGSQENPDMLYYEYCIWCQNVPDNPYDVSEVLIHTFVNGELHHTRLVSWNQKKCPVYPPEYGDCLDIARLAKGTKVTILALPVDPRKIELAAENQLVIGS